MKKTRFVRALEMARSYAKNNPNPFNMDDPDDTAEVWNDMRDLFDQKTDGELTARELDVVADEVVNHWRGKRAA